MRWIRGVQAVRLAGFAVLCLLRRRIFHGVADAAENRRGGCASGFLSVAKAGGFNLILDDGVTGRVTLNLSGEPERLLELIAASQGLCAVRDGDVYVVTTAKSSGDASGTYLYSPLCGSA